MPELMDGGRFSKPMRQGDTVERRLSPASANVHALLRHFERIGFTLAPRVLGITADGRREVLSFIEGKTGYPPLPDAQRSDEALVEVARAIRAMHDATQGFVPVRPNAWHDQEAAVPARINCIGHHDLAPWNIVFDGSQVVGIIDWDSIRPSNRVWDLSYAAHQFVPLHPPASLAPFGWNDEPERAARLKLFADAYGLGVTPPEILDHVVLRLVSIAAHIEQEVRAGNPDFEVHRQENHAEGYRAAAQFILDNRTALLV
ncbi:phosphotransferase enzyme family protein [Actinopolymorpha alba]|uniref:phosphotransferase enzyme family protein n=1 Tax=Actinopolymorpha alba TaxID=533267 RepID=UPI0004765136|nr:aminoglycoside phosphotransferase family protein [Actinopolymorpha alba]